MIYFVRHGQTDWNLEKKLQGRADISLNQNGIHQAYEAKEKLKNIRFDKVFCSPLKRAKETCQIITDHKIVFDDRLIERDFGEYEGVRKTDCDYEGFWNSTKNQKFLRAENVFDVEKRVYAFLDEITKQNPNENIMIVCHGGVGLIISSYFNGRPDDGDYLQFLANNGEILCFDNKKQK